MSRSNTSRCDRIEMYSPAAIENAPARSPATPASTMIVLSTAAPVNPMIRDRFDTRPSLTPKMAARRAPLRPPATVPSPFSATGPRWGRIVSSRLLNSPRSMLRSAPVSTSSAPSRRFLAPAVVPEELLDLRGQRFPRRDVRQGGLFPRGLLQPPDVLREALVVFNDLVDPLFPRVDGRFEVGGVHVHPQERGHPLHQGERGPGVHPGLHVVGDGRPEGHRREAGPVRQVVEHSHDP